VGALREEIAELRSELVEKVGGQLRLERIETTRVIGSDLEALQHEVRQLKAATEDTAEGVAARLRTELVRQIVEPARVRPVSRQTAEVQASVVPAQQAPQPHPPVTVPIAPATAPVAPQPRPAAASASAAPAPGAELNGLPRITPFTEFELDPIEEDPGYTGRRRRSEDSDGSSRHAAPEPRSRRHRAAEGDDDLLARLLARESR
jgi:hypothetical protein